MATVQSTGNGKKDISEKSKFIRGRHQAFFI